MIDIHNDKHITITITERLDATNADEAREIIESKIHPIDRDVLIDVDSLKYISSAGLQIILYIAKEAKAAGKQTFLHGAKGEVEDIFKLSGFLTFLKEI